MSLKEVAHRVPIPPGPPSIPDNIWLCYSGRRHVISASAATSLLDVGDNPAWGIGIWLPMAVDRDEPDEDGPVVPVPAADRVPLVVDGVERETWHYADGGLHIRAALVAGTYYAAICLAGQAGETRLVTR